MQHRTTFPPARVVVELRHLLESQLLVVIGTDPLASIESALLQCRVYVTARDLLRHNAELGDDATCKSADAHFQPVEIGNLLDLLAEPATHLRAGIAGGKREDIELLVEVIHQLHAAAEIHPSGLHAAV